MITGNDLDLTGRTVIVTGASGGIGSGIARRFAEAGANVVCHYQSNSAAAEAVASGITAAGGKAVASQADISTTAGVEALVAHAVSHFGGLHAVVNNAGHQPVEMLVDAARLAAGDTGAADAVTKAIDAIAVVRLIADSSESRRLPVGMVTNPPRGVPHVYPRLAYQDPDAAVAWLERAFGLKEIPSSRLVDDEARIQLTDLALGKGRVMIGRADAETWLEKRT